MKSLNFTLRGRGRGRGQGECGDEALVIAKAMPKLLHLQLHGTGLTNRGLQAILDCCPDLESLDLDCCSGLNLSKELEKRCAERIKILHLPQNPIETDFGGSGYGDYTRNSDYEEYSDYPDSNDEDYLYSHDYNYDYDDVQRWWYY